MFNSSLYEKNSSNNTEGFSVGRSNISAKFPIGLTNMGDENQQIRIQLAVHKYNNLTGGTPYQSRTYLTPVRHSYLKSSLRSRSNQDESESSSKSERKIKDEYEGVGAFPTIHLKKSAIRYRPLRKYNDVKVPNPELPLTRFLSQLPEFSTESKSNTRSVLDVLEDLSSKKICLNESDDCSKGRKRGLGGDIVVAGEPAYRPLFVQKPKMTAVLTKDSTTQTLVTHGVTKETSRSHDSNKLTLNEDPSDPRVQLRKKLAKLNNEIFASLSSSISLQQTKRKLDKVLPSENNESFVDVLSSKRIKMNGNSSEEKTASKMNGSNHNESTPLLNRKAKLNDTTSPKKDRLTTIYLDMQNVSPKAEMFQKNSSTENSTDNNMQNSATINGTSESEKLEENSSVVITTSEASTNTNTLPAPQFKLPASKALNLNPNQTSINNNSINFSFPSSGIKLGNQPEDSQKTNNSIENNSTILNKTPSSTVNLSSNQTTCANTQSFPNSLESNNKLKESPSINFKFGTENSISPANKSPEPLKTFGSIITSESSPFKLNTTPQFSFGVKKLESPVSTSSNEQTTITSTKSELSFRPKPNFTFGQTSSPSLTQVNSDTKPTEKEVSTSSTGSTLTTTFSLPQKPLFSFGKSTEEPEKGFKPLDQTVSSSPQAATLKNDIPVSTISNVSSQNTFPSLQPSADKKENVVKPMFSFGQKPNTDLPAFSFTPTSSTAEQKTTTVTTTAPTFTFGVKSSEFNENKAPANVLEPKTTTSMFSFGQKPLVSETSQTKDSSSNSSGIQTATTTVSSQSPPKIPSLFAQSIPNPLQTSTSLSSLTPNSSSTSSNKTESKPLETAAFPKTNFFGVPTTTQSSTVFGTTSNQSITGFGSTSSTQPTSLFGSTSSAQNPIFGTVPSTQTSIGFGASANTQTTSTFGAPMTTKSSVFGSDTAAKPPVFDFGASSSTGFNAPNNSQTDKTFVFGSPSQTTFGQPVDQNTNKTSTSLGQTSNIFSQNTTSPNLGVGNSVFGTSNFGTSSQNVFGAKVDSPANAFGQTLKIENSPFGQPSQPQAFDTQNKFSFGTSTSTPAGFTSPSSNNPSPSSIFNFGGGGTTNSGQSSGFGFGGNTSGLNNTQTPFNFKANDTFKFGTSTNKETGTGFGSATNSGGFNFGSQINNNMGADAKPQASTFNFGSNQTAPSAPAFNFGSASSSSASPSVFNFGGASSSNNSSFNFGSPQPLMPFGQNMTPSPAPFTGPGTFSIGTGSSQSRPKASTRLRRRP